MKKIIPCLFVILFAASCSNNDDNLTELGDDGTCLMNTDWFSGTCMYNFIKKWKWKQRIRYYTCSIKSYRHFPY